MSFIYGEGDLAFVLDSAITIFRSAKIKLSLKNECKYAEFDNGDIEIIEKRFRFYIDFTLVNNSGTKLEDLADILQNITSGIDVIPFYTPGLQGLVIPQMIVDGDLNPEKLISSEKWKFRLKQKSTFPYIPVTFEELTAYGAGLYSNGTYGE